MAKTASRPNSTISLEDNDPGVPMKFGSGRWRKANQVSGTRFKICLTGRQSVGKTSVFLRLQGCDFSDVAPECSTSTYEYFDLNDPTVEVSLSCFLLLDTYLYFTKCISKRCINYYC